MKAFGNVHPFVLLVYFLSVLTVAMFAANPVLSLTALLGGILFCAMLVRRSRVPGDIGSYVPLFLLVAVTNPLFLHNGVTAYRRCSLSGTPAVFSERQPGHAGGAPVRVRSGGGCCRCSALVQGVQRGNDRRQIPVPVRQRDSQIGSCTVHGTPVRTAVQAADEACPVRAKDDGAVRGARLYG